jgi:uncharacterized protein (UPF0276 family)
MFPYFGFALRQRDIATWNRPTTEAVELTLEQAALLGQSEHVPASRDCEYVSLHAHRHSLGCDTFPGFDYLHQLRDLAMAQGAASVTQYLGGAHHLPVMEETQPFLPPAWTEAVLDATSRNVHFLQNFCSPLQFCIETVAYLFRQPGEMSEAEFLSRLLTRTGCGWVLNMTSLYANATNFRFDAYEFMAEVLPAAQRVQIHLAGGYFDDAAGVFVDSRTHGVPEAVWDLYRFALNQARGKIEAVFLERDQLAAADNELRHARRLADETLRIKKPAVARVG